MSEEQEPQESQGKPRRKPKQAKAATPAAPAELAKSQAFTIARMNRADLKAAPYNPRVIGDSEKKRLRLGLERNGLVSTVTWNKRTGNIVGGHRRIEQMDAIEGKKDYLLDVAVIDVDENREKEINVLLNNPQAMGQWDMDQLGTILRDPTVELAGTGFDVNAVHALFGDSVTGNRDDPLDDLAETIRDARDRYDGVSKEMSERRGTEHYLVIVFRNDAACTKFLTDHQLPDNRYQSGDDIAGLIEGGKKPAPPVNPNETQANSAAAPAT